jgi:outer membrane receptor for ferrienterochelin and colicins
MKLVVLVLGLAVSLGSYARAVEVLSGTVMSTDSIPLSGAHVLLSDGRGTTTNDSGYFRFEHVPSWGVTLTVSMVGYHSKAVSIESMPERGSNIVVVMTPETTVLNDIVITATRSLREASSLPVMVTIADKKQIAASGSLRLSDVLAEQTGLAIINNHGTGLQVQGFDADYTLILLNGEPLIGRTAGTLDLSRVAVGNVKQIEVLKGPASSLYGSEAMAGVVNIITDRAENTSMNVFARYGTNQTADLSLSANYRKNTSAVSLFVDRYSSDGYDLAPETSQKTVDPFRTYTFQANAEHPIGRRLTVAIGTRYYTERQDRFLSVTDGSTSTVLEGYGSIDEWNISPSVALSLGSKLTSTFRLYSTGYNTASELYEVSDKQSYESDFFRQRFARAELSAGYTFSDAHVTSVGSGYVFETVEATRYTRRKDAASQYVFLQHEWIPNQQLNITGGVRLDRHSRYPSRVSPKLSLRFEPLRWMKFMASVGTGFKAPDFRHLYLNFDNTVSGYTVLGSEEVSSGIIDLERKGLISQYLIAINERENLSAERSTAFNAGVTFTGGKNKRILWSINVFRNNVSDLIETLPVARKTNGQAVYSYTNLNSIYTQGIESELRFMICRYVTMSAGYQLLEAKDRDIEEQVESGKVYARDPHSGGTYRVTEDQYKGLFNRSKHMVNARVFVENFKGWGGSIRGIYRGRYGFTDINANGILDDDSEFAEGYLIVNGSVSKKLFRIATLQAGVDNVFDTTNEGTPAILPGRLYWMSLNLTLKKNN